jgi:hypothetical protein
MASKRLVCFADKRALDIFFCVLVLVPVEYVFPFFVAYWYYSRSVTMILGSHLLYRSLFLLLPVAFIKFGALSLLCKEQLKQT